MLFTITLTSVLLLQCVSSSSAPFNVESHECNKNDVSDLESSLWKAASDGTRFDNPKFDCKHKSQIDIYAIFKNMEMSPELMAANIHQDAHFHVFGHHPLSGIYPSLDKFFVNSMWRLFKTYDDHIDEHKNSIFSISGGCDDEWSTQETVQEIRSNVGKHYYIYTAWATRWSGGKIAQARIFLDGGAVEELLHNNEVWSNATMDLVREEYVPGPQGMPPMAMLQAFESHKTQKSDL